MKNISFIILFSCVIGCQGVEENNSRVDILPYYEDANFTPKWFSGESQIPNDFHRIPKFNLFNQSGQNITQKHLDNKIYVADFFFTSCPGICPKMTSNMSLIQDFFKNDEDVVLISHSVMPEFDSVSVLKAYAESKGIINNKWHLVTGDRNHIYDLGRNFYFVEEDLGIEKNNEDFLHTENFVLIDKNKYIRGIYNGLNKSSVNQLIEDIKTLKG